MILAIINNKSLLVADCQLHHLQPRPGRGNRRLAMRRLRCRNKAHFTQLQRSITFQRGAQMPEVNRIKGTAEDAYQFHRAVTLLANVAITQHDKFLRRQSLKTHRPANMQLVSTDADLGAEPVFKTIGKPG